MCTKFAQNRKSMLYLSGFCKTWKEGVQHSYTHTNVKIKRSQIAVSKARPTSASEYFLYKRCSCHIILSQNSLYSLHQKLSQCEGWWFKNTAGLQSTMSHSKYTGTEVWWPFCWEIIDVGLPSGSVRCPTVWVSNQNHVVASVHFLVLYLLSSKQNLIFLEKNVKEEKTNQQQPLL